MLLGHRVEPLLGTGDVVLADLAVLLELLEVLLRVAADVPDADLALFGLGLGDLDVLLAAVLGQLREGAPGSESRMAFSMLSSAPMSNGVTMIVRAS